MSESLEVEKKFFGFHPVSFIDDVLNAMDDYCADAVGEMEIYMSKQKEFQNPNTRPHIKTVQIIDQIRCLKFRERKKC